MLHLAFCQENSQLADVLEKNAPEIGYVRISDADYTTPGTFAQALTDAPGKVLLLVTDNFMKSAACMSGMLQALLGLMRQDRVLVAIANGVSEENGVQTSVETHIDRVVYAIQYMNYWQQRYLALSDQYYHAPEDKKANLFQQQQAIHDIADQAGELISALRDCEPIKWDYLSVTGFDRLYRWVGATPPVVPVALPAEPAVVAPPPLETLPSPDPEPPAEPVVVAPPTLAAPPTSEPAPPPVTAPVHVSGPLTFRPVEPEPSGQIEHSAVQPEPITSHLTPVEEPPFDPSKHLIVNQISETELPQTQQGEYREQEIEHTIRDAWDWINRGNRDLGIEVLRLALEQYPDSERLRTEYEKALGSTEEDDTSDDALAYLAAGESSFDDDDFLMAKYCWDRAAEANPNLPGIWKKLGMLTSEQLDGYRETSIAYLQRAAIQDPTDTEVTDRLRSLGIDVPTNETTPEEAPAAPSTALPHSEIADAPVAVAEPAVEPTPEPIVAPTPPATEPAWAATAPLTTPEAPVAPTRHLRDEIVMVTGATSGIGKATAIEFARHGYRIIITGRRAERLFDLRNQLERDFGVEVLPLVFDVREQRAVESTLSQLPQSWKNIDILINNAGLAKGLAPIHEGELHHWETMIDTNIKGLLYVSQLVSRTMVERRRGHIVNLSSSAGKEAYPNGNVYCATKFAVEALTKSMRFDLHKYGIRVSQVSPGHVEETEFALTRFDGDADKAQIYADFQPLTARDVAEAIWFIASRPAHVNVQDVYMFGTQQASATVVDRSGRN
jgi:NADP-dependent 3-hydroxy acid dehydrogenase YdfG/tetratricopeptide (TPR) repeat protein